jgi:hypothetical protein
MAKGGRRPGAGRPRKTAEEHFVTGDAGHRGRVLAHPSSTVPAPQEPVVVPVLTEADVPADLTRDEQAIWLELAPWAMAHLTLIPATRAAFVAFVRWEALSRALAASVLERGSSKHLNAHKEALKGYYDFQLRPTGKPLPTAQPAQQPANPLERFLKRSL